MCVFSVHLIYTLFLYICTPYCKVCNTHHGESGEQGGRLAGGLELGTTQLELPPGQVGGRVEILSRLRHAAAAGAVVSARLKAVGLILLVGAQLKGRRLGRK